MGRCQGSGKQPYRTQIDLGEPAFKCSCPSRKFPCKHGLGLYLLLDASPALFKGSDAPAWVGDWMQSRQGRLEKKAEKAAVRSAPSTEADAAAAAQARKREEKREQKVDAGLRELQTWLHDLARLGRATGDVQPLHDGPGVTAPIETLLDDYAHALAAQAFLDRFPTLLAGLVPDAGGHGILRDAHGRAIGLHPSFRHGAHRLAMSGGHPLTVFGEWDGRTSIALGEPLATVLPADAGAVEVRLWMAIGALDLWERSGFQPAALPPAPASPAPPKQLRPCPARAEALLALLLRGAHPAGLLTEWLQLLGRHGARLPARFLPNLLDAAARQPRLRPWVAPVLGERGQWLARRQPAWNWACPRPTQPSARWRGIPDRPTSASPCCATGARTTRPARAGP